MNHAHMTLLGHLGKDPVYDEKNETARFSVAHTRKRKTGDLVTWWQVTAWRQSAKIAAQFLKKGDAVGVVGTPYMDAWKDQNGIEKQLLKIDANEIILMGQKPIAQGDTERLPVVPVKPVTPIPTDDEPPF